ncbi:unannotated protein [freshwater metagenome]|uniref:Unannotated protein n=1 Tax=freshwater metagenome TaxID=449393 RepID=A0A6J6NQG0_9ZZZZ
MRHLSNEWYVGVDPHTTKIETLRHAHRPAEVASPHRRRKAVVDAVGPTHSLVFVGELLHGDDRSEHFVLHHFVGLTKVGHNRWGVEVTRRANASAASNDVGVIGGTVEEASDASKLIGIVHGAVQHVFVVGHTGLNASRRSTERSDELVIDAGGNKHSRGGSAVLTRIEEPGGRDAFDSGFDVGVVEHHHGSLATKFEVQTLEAVRGGLGHFHACAN